MNKKFIKEVLVNFALVYSFMVGIIFVSYSLFRGFFEFQKYIWVFIIFLIYFAYWIYEKKRYLHEYRTKTTNNL